jgi:hypothetical protein
MSPQPGYQNPSPGGYPGYPDDRYGNQSSPAGEVGFFYQELSPYGDWIFTYEYGWTWLPRDVAFGWRPYTYGQWVPSDYGWFWVSYEPFGWATYHFGRWAWHPRLGWIWVPGRTWGPAWVSWQSGNGYIGWAPLPPEVGFDVSVGLRLGGFDLRVGISADAYTFVEERNFLDRDPYRYAQPAARNVTIIQNTTNITNYTVIDNRVVNRGVDLERIERSTGRRVQQMHVRETETDKREQVRGDEVVVYHPSKVHLDSVRVDENRPRRGRGEAPPANAQQEPSTRSGHPTPPTRSELEVAPRVRPEAPVKEERVQREEQQERQKFDAYERNERQRLEKVHDMEREKAKTQAEAAAVAQRQAEEKRALEENLKRAEQQLQGRQEVERKAEQATPPPDKQKAADKKGKEKGSERGKKKSSTEEPPPPPFR